MGSSLLLISAFTPPRTCSNSPSVWHADTARPVVARLSAATAAEAGVSDGDKVAVVTERGSVTVPVEIVPMADHAVWLPAAGLPAHMAVVGLDQQLGLTTRAHRLRV